MEHLIKRQGSHLPNTFGFGGGYMVVVVGGLASRMKNLVK
jgi:hypothetical protein